jgi:hypothetical protein
VTETLITFTGELVDLEQAPVDVIGQIAEDIDRRLEELRSDKRALGDEITRRLDFEGRRSLEIGHWRFETTAPEEREIDVPALQAVLLDLVVEGTISQKKADRVIAWTPKVVWTELKYAGTGALPRTGLDVAPLLIAGVLLIVIAMGIKAHV